MVVVPAQDSRPPPDDDRRHPARASLNPGDDPDRDFGRLLDAAGTRNRGRAKLLVSRLCRAVTKRFGSLRDAKGDRQAVQQDYVVDDDADASRTRTWCDITIPNSVSIAPDPPSRREAVAAASSSSRSSIRPTGQMILSRRDYLAVLARLSAHDRAVLIRRAAKQFVDALAQGSLRPRAPSSAARQYYTFYHVQVAVEFCQYQPETDFFPAPTAYNLQYGLQCLNKCLALDRFLLYCDADRIEYERHTGMIDANAYLDSNPALAKADTVDKIVKELEHYRRHMDRGAAPAPKPNKS